MMSSVYLISFYFDTDADASRQGRRTPKMKSRRHSQKEKIDGQELRQRGYYSDALSGDADRRISVRAIFYNLFYDRQTCLAKQTVRRLALRHKC